METNATDAVSVFDPTPSFVFPMRFLRALPVLLLAFVTPLLHAQREKFSTEDLEYIEKTWPDAKKTNTGIRYVILKEGESGAPSPKPGNWVSVLYVGKLLRGQQFESLQDREHPFKFRVARESVIEGWDQVLVMMKRGEKRLVIIPPELAYGSRGQLPKIPRNAALVFEIELIEISTD